MKNNNDTLKIIELPVKRWKEYKALRIEAVTDAPLAFVTTREEVIDSKNTLWQNKLKESEKNKGNFWVFAEDEGNLVGMVGAYQGNLERLKHNATIVGVYVNKNYRGLNLGKKMFDVLFKKIRKNKEIIRLDLEVTKTQLPAINLYRALGFKKIGVLQKELKCKGKYYDQISMEKFIK